MEELDLKINVEMTPTELQYWNTIKHNVDGISVDFLTIDVSDVKATLEKNNWEVPSTLLIVDALDICKKTYDITMESDAVMFKVIEILKIIGVKNAREK